ncbi:hypothetical protein OH76DRAFT_198379 [Lentinus brumalis]|uniref:Uncharacterized protein n=1 Tax=Lentinus brumalis TaxID=2498619 RepID=A0A371DI79_9APHY|nr:hypothetical protein OH76DRAFT_198379 [Polyporus brumalis]
MKETCWYFIATCCLPQIPSPGALASIMEPGTPLSALNDACGPWLAHRRRARLRPARPSAIATNVLSSGPSPSAVGASFEHPSSFDKPGALLASKVSLTQYAQIQLSDRLQLRTPAKQNT